MSHPSNLSPLTLKKASMLEGAHNNVFHGGTFVTNATETTKKIDIGRLTDMVAPNAILNAGGRADEVRCYPGTREEVIGKVEKWMDDVKTGSCTNRMMWLSGPAGAGKSAICQTVAERCPTHGQQAANFFFFRGDQTRNRAQPLVPTLIYQLRDSYPMLDDFLSNCLTAHPLIYKASISEQFRRLISSPIKTIQQSSPTHETIVLFIDGLDECDENMKQDEILTALRALVDADHSPFLALISSRADPHLIMSFNRLGTSVESIFLDDEYKPRDDIFRFVAAKFDEIKRVHHLCQLLSQDWPAQADIDAIINKSSGQFIYAATVMRFIQYSPESPALSLVTILKMRPSVGNNPLAQLDAVYSHIFSKVSNIQSAKLILCAYFVTNSSRRHTIDGVDNLTHQEVLHLLGFKFAEVKSIFANLGAIIQVTTDPLHLTFYHASLQDYLTDKVRSGDYHVDIGQIAASLSAICFQNIHDQETFDLVFRISPLVFVEMGTLELSKSLLDASIRDIHSAEGSEVWCWHMFIRAIEKLYFQTDRKLFKKLLRRWVHFLYLNNLYIDQDVPGMGPAASWYYKWCIFTERAKFKLNLA